jgi:predicted amidohydrolase YtcJ
MPIAFTNGVVFGHPNESTVIVDAGRIIHVGPHDGFKAPDEVIDLSGRTLLPGFADAHVHPPLAGLEMAACNLLEVRHEEQAYLAEIQAYAQRSNAPWITGAGWAMSAFEQGIPTAASLDTIVPDRPTVLWNADHHGVWVNSKALEIAGISASSPDPTDGRIERDREGNPTGCLQEGAAELVLALVPEPTIEDQIAGIITAQEYLLTLGVTAWQDAFVTPEIHDAYITLDARGGLIGTVVGGLWWERSRGADQIAEFTARRDSAPTGRYTPNSVKIMLDGVAENHTASMLEPYRTPAGTTSDNLGIDFIDPDDLKGYVTALDAAGFQVHFHALGDRAVRYGLDSIEAAIFANGDTDRRHHLAHLQVVDRADVPRFAHLGAVANAQPLWACHEEEMDTLTIPFLHPGAAEHQYPWRSLLDAGATLAFGSDWPVSTPDPLKGIGTAVARMNSGSRPIPFLPEQRLTMHEAIAAYTAGTAFVSHRERVAGTIERGYEADLVVVDRPLVTAEDAFEAAVDMTMVAGSVVHER